MYLLVAPDYDGELSPPSRLGRAWEALRCAPHVLHFLARGLLYGCASGCGCCSVRCTLRAATATLLGRDAWYADESAKPYCTGKEELDAAIGAGLVHVVGVGSWRELKEHPKLEELARPAR